MYKSRLIYLAIIIAAFVFSQALYESVSFMTFIIVLVLPVISIVFSLFSFPLVSVKLSTSGRDIYRFDKFVVRFTIFNKSPFVSPSFKIYCSVPDSSGQKNEQVVFILNSPFGRRGYFDYTSYFSIRGIHKVYVDAVEYYDFLKLIKIKKNISKSVVIKVKPRKINLDVPVNSERNMQENSNIAGVATVEYGGDMLGVREYLHGDNLKNVHWKLSAKSDDIIMKSFAENVFDKAYIIADLCSYYSNQYLSRSMTDCVVEAALSAIRDYAENSVRFGLIITKNKGESERFSIATPSDLFEAEQTLSAAPMIEETTVIDLLNNIDFNMLSGSEVCIITSFGVTDILNGVKKIFIDKKCKVSIINISEYDEADKNGMIVYSREYIENLSGNI